MKQTQSKYRALDNCKHGCYIDYGQNMIAQFCPTHDKTPYDIKALARVLLIKMIRAFRKENI